MQADRPSPDLPAQRAQGGPPTRFPAPVDTALRTAGWQPGRWDIRQAEVWADALRDHRSPAGHRHAVFPAAVEAWSEFGGLHITSPATGRQLAPATLHLNPLHGLHMARTLGDLGRALHTEVAPLGQEPDTHTLLAVDAVGRAYALDHTGDWYLGPTVDQALTALLTGIPPVRLTAG
ncbi:SUKH-3 domain-containing protein [Streptomyces sp. CRN 30]|uniref:SUKH-3 domain-containing protein n=1 Tax=Streptomyces sp. CRN 30 TaxID=3075613 RepID=UPI002A812492|nr:SUKH-3 domain-containing protein [Streptomyces sp. CRN 30]